MKWNFFYRDDNDRKYNKLDDWYREIKHLVLPTLVFFLLIVVILAYFSF